ncbi:alpha-1,3-mannosyl-glycoprotein 2-beta-N-acetylglucosaminyltransferase [Platysternon megacephalum]|uniref:Alpha-1,3-mannosyl-glycoprotein 2-beta-N-acetylglucosaminyltransferase n=1 Tax=Platysternon megacephalum TaxID=55544 RepID=A0A4D9DT53_9SAUR|nr:alpha-1,3-mannosyl-glycoprotein 2-beta-N-acetylglucosaminyltransferase [Platysternon megacephalum]
MYRQRAASDPRCCLDTARFIARTTLHVLEDIAVLVVPGWQKEVLFQAARGNPGMCATEVFKHRVTEPHSYTWSGLASYIVALEKYALP